MMFNSYCNDKLTAWKKQSPSPFRCTMLLLYRPQKSKRIGNSSLVVPGVRGTNVSAYRTCTGSAAVGGIARACNCLARPRVVMQGGLDIVVFKISSVMGLVSKSTHCEGGLILGSCGGGIEELPGTVSHMSNVS